MLGVVTVFGVLTLVPYPLKLDAKGQLLPQSRQYVFSAVEGQVVASRGGGAGEAGDRITST